MIRALIVTYYCTNNYGSFLQAYALGEYLAAHGCEVFYLGSTELEAANILSEPNAYREGRDEVLAEARASFRIDYEGKTVYDLIVVGSDVVWASPKIKPFWSQGLSGHCRISYAASMHGMMNRLPLSRRLCRLLEYLRLFPKRHILKKFKGISVRDDRTYRTVRRLLGKRRRIEKVLDPTFLLDPSHLEGLARSIPEPYIMVYSYGLVGEDINPVFEYARAHHCKICVVGYRAAFADYNPTCTPFELLSLLAHAEAILTTTFHGTALSLLMQGNFVTLESAKARELLKDMALLDRFVTAGTACTALEAPIDYVTVNQRIEDGRRVSKEFLDRQIRIAEEYHDKRR